MKIIAYTLAVGTTPDDLNNHVGRLIPDGWQPFGGVATTIEIENEVYAQAMVKYDEMTP
jgi:hypothetical protein